MNWKIVYVITFILLLTTTIYHYDYVKKTDKTLQKKNKSIEIKNNSIEFKDYKNQLLIDYFISGKNRSQIKDALKDVEGKYDETDSSIIFLNLQFFFNEKDSLIEFKN